MIRPMRSSATATWIALALLATQGSCGAPPPGDPDSVLLLAEILRLEDRRSAGEGRLRMLTGPEQDAATRARAALALGRIGPPAARPEDLASLMGDPDASLRGMAAFALGEMEDPGAVPLLLGAIGDEDARVRAHAAEALGKIPDPSVIPRLDPLIEDPDDEVSRMALMSIWRLEPGPGVPDQARRAGPICTGDASLPRRRGACYFLMRTQIRHPSSREPHDAIRSAARDVDPLIRSWVARTIGSYTGEGADRAGITALAADPDWRVRVEAFNALRRHGVVAWSVYPPGLEDSHPAVAMAALASLEGCPDARAREVLEAALADPRPRRREIAITAFARRDGESARAEIEALADDPEWSVRARIAETPAAAPGSALAARLLRDPDPRVRTAAVAALGTHGEHPEAARLAREASRDPDLYVRAAALDVLAGTRAAPGAEAVLKDLAAGYDRGLGDAGEEARLSALAGLGSLAADAPGEGIRAVIERAMLDPSRLVRARAAAILRDVWSADRSDAIGEAETHLTQEDYLEAARRAGREVHALFETDAGSIRVALHTGDAPLTAHNLIRLARRGALDGLAFHRVVPGFVIQDGDPRGDGNGGPGWRIRCEINLRRYVAGAVGMALSGKDTGGSQYFMTQTPQPHLDGGYTIFGQVVSGQDHVEATVQGDRIRRVSIEEGP